jgi:L-cysteine:1D-myo-inositol 2-amino-2-deoxy-alpha-D-glucopyranoside ligase
VLAEVRERMADDLDAPGALAVIDAWVDDVLAGRRAASASSALSALSALSARLVADAADALLGVKI